MKIITKTHKCYLASIITVQYSSGLAFFFLQGKIISAILKRGTLHNIMIMLIIMMLAKSVMILSNTTLEHTKNQIENTVINNEFIS